jgi:hypothetical protein
MLVASKVWHDCHYQHACEQNGRTEEGQGDVCLGGNVRARERCEGSQFMGLPFMASVQNAHVWFHCYQTVAAVTIRIMKTGGMMAENHL